MHNIVNPFSDPIEPINKNQIFTTDLESDNKLKKYPIK